MNPALNVEHVAEMLLSSAHCTSGLHGLVLFRYHLAILVFICEWCNSFFYLRVFAFIFSNVP